MENPLLDLKSQWRFYLDGTKRWVAKHDAEMKIGVDLGEEINAEDLKVGDSILSVSYYVYHLSEFCTDWPLAEIFPSFPPLDFLILIRVSPTFPPRLWADTTTFPKCR